MSEHPLKVNDQTLSAEEKRQQDQEMAGFSPIWLKAILRQQLGFQGVIFSDNLDMVGAQAAGSPAERAAAALAAGCDMVLACNNRQAAIAILNGLKFFPDPVSQLRLARLHGRGRLTLARMRTSPSWKRAVQLVQDYDAFPDPTGGQESGIKRMSECVIPISYGELT